MRFWKGLVIVNFIGLFLLYQRSLTIQSYLKDYTSTSSKSQEGSFLEFNLKIPDWVTLGSDTFYLKGPAKERFLQELEWYLERKDVLRRIWRRSFYYFPLIEEILTKEGLPSDLKYLAVAESELNPFALSSKKAAGLWQFMKITAQRYGLKINRIIDERRDPVKSTQAASLYLKDLYDEFNSWKEVIAAYNIGEKNLRYAFIQQEVSCFDEVWLNFETMRLPFRVIAVKFIFEKILPKICLFSNKLDKEERPQYFKIRFRLIHKSSLTKIAKILHTTNYYLRLINPALKTSVLPPGIYELNIPPESQAFLEKIKKRKYTFLVFLP